MELGPIRPIDDDDNNNESPRASQNLKKLYEHIQISQLSYGSNKDLKLDKDTNKVMNLP